MSTISAGTNVNTSLNYSADTTGNLVFQSGSSSNTVLTLDNTQNATFTGNVSVKTPTGSYTDVASGVAKAWVNCSGATINGSFNVSSITYLTTGRFRINFATAMPNANYAVVAMGAPATDIGMCCYTGYQTLYGTNSTTIAYVTTVNVAGPALITPANLYVVVFSS